jgi:hypothetical protein
MLYVKNDKSSRHSLCPDVVTPTNKRFSHTHAGDAVSTTKHSLTITPCFTSQMRQYPIRARNKHDSGRHEALFWLHNPPFPLLRVLQSRRGSNECFLYSHNFSVHHFSGLTIIILQFLGMGRETCSRTSRTEWKMQKFPSKSPVKMSSPKKNEVNISQPGTLWFVQTTHTQRNLNWNVIRKLKQLGCNECVSNSALIKLWLINNTEIRV